MKAKKILCVVMTMAMALAVTITATGCGSSAKEETTTTETTSDVSTDAANPTNIYENMAGEYQDEVSQRATATLTADMDSDNVQITIKWAEDSEDTEEWEMTATMKDDKLVYDDCICTDIEYDENGDVTNEETEYTNGSGYFEFGDDGQLLWTGAKDDDCRSCSFVLNQE